MVDSTPIIHQLETLYPGRSVLPPNPVVRFLDYLLEDYADEWLTKAMFHYRWCYRPDIDKAGAILPRWRSLTATDEELIPMAEFVKKRQISRLHVVGSNDVTAVVIENSYKRLLKLMSAHMNQSSFVFGNAQVPVILLSMDNSASFPRLIRPPRQWRRNWRPG